MNQLTIGAIVRNFGELCKVIRFHEVTGDPILRPLWNDGSEWLAKAELCEPVTALAAPLCHRDGLAIFG